MMISFQKIIAQFSLPPAMGEGLGMGGANFNLPQQTLAKQQFLIFN